MTVLAVRDLYKSFGGVRAVAGVSFEIGRGELLALIGPNGAGKSTCFNMIGGQLRPDAGDILFEGRSIAGLRPRQIWRLGVGRTFQVAATFASMTVIENVQLALASHHGRLHDMVGSLGACRRSEAQKLLDRNGEAQSKAPGFVSRQTLVSRSDLTKITTLVVWTTNDIYDAWRASPERAVAMSGAEALWAKPPESERFDMVE